MTDVAVNPPTPTPTPAAPPAPTSIFEPQWPAPGRAAPRLAIAGAAATGVIGAATLSWDRPGAGWLATTVVATAVVLGTARSGGQPAHQRLNRAIWAGLGLALIADGTLRSAGWLWWLCLPVACVCGALALSGGRAPAALSQGLLAYPFAMVRALPWGLRGGAAGRQPGRTSVGRVAVAAAIGLALLVVFGSLLSGADAAFGHVLATIVPTLDGAEIARWILTGALIAVGTLAACFLALRPPRYDRPAPAVRRGVGRIEWTLPVGAVVALFAAFVGVQATVLFGGGDHVLQTAGLTYAQYARQGFWQLLAVTALTLVVIAVAARLAGRQTRADRVWVRSLLGALALLTLVIVASALSRMWAYEQAYGYSRLRLLVSVCEGWLGLVFVLCLVAGIGLRGRWVPRVAAQTAAAALVALVVASPDQVVAAQNIERYRATGSVDLAYLASLSTDAVPTLAALTGDQRRCVLARIAERRTPEPWTAWNLGRARANAVLSSTTVDGSNCEAVLFPVGAR